MSYQLEKTSKVLLNFLKVLMNMKLWKVVKKMGKVKVKVKMKVKMR